MFNLDRFRMLCKERGVKQTALFAMVGKPRTYSSDLNKIKNVPMEYVRVWADALRTTPEYLMGETGDPSEGIKKEPTSLMADRFDGDVLAIMEIVQHLSPEDKALVLERCRTLYEKEKQ